MATADKNITLEDQILPRLRRELKATAQIYDGQPYWVVKDPMSLRYYRFNREEYFILEQLRRGVTLTQLKQAHRQEFKTDALNNQDIGVFVRTLLQKNLLISDHPERDRLMYESARKRARGKFISGIRNFMFVKIPLYDPDKLFSRMVPRLQFLWSRTFFFIYLIMLAVAGVLIAQRWHDFMSMVGQNLFTLRNLPLLLVSFWLVKTIHEFGHGLTCKYYGGEVHELGVLLIVFSPMFYCNITDSWTFTRKWPRLLTTAGGIMSELLIAALATVVWYFTEPPGFIHTWMFNLIMICSVSTILFNANPLLRYDGYYFIMDLIEVPNLRQRSARLMNDLFVKYILGGHPTERPEEHRFRYMFPLYAICSTLYRWFIVIAIAFMIYEFLKELRLVMLGRFMLLSSLVSMLIIPVVRTGQMVIQQRRAMGVSRQRLMVLLALLVLFAGAALFWPLEQTITLNFILEPARVQWLRTDVEGAFAWSKDPSGASSRVKEGQWLDPATDAVPAVAQLRNSELLLQQQRLQADIDITKTGLAQYTSRGLAGSVRQFEERLASLQNDLGRVQQQLDALTMTPPFKGAVLSSDREMQAMEGGYIKRGAPLLLLADTRKLLAKVWVPETTWARIFKKNTPENQNAELLLYAFSGQPFTGRVVSVNQQREQSMGEFNEKLALSNKVGGEVLTEYDPVTKKEKPIEPAYEITIALDDATIPAAARSYMSGRVRIDCGKYTLYRWTRDSVLRLISSEVRL